MAPESENPYVYAQRQFDIAADMLNLDSGLRRILRVPQRELTVNFPVKMDDGSIEVFTGFRVQHSLARGPGKGGVRYHPDVTLEEVMALAAWMSIKNAAVNLTVTEFLIIQALAQRPFRSLLLVPAASAGLRHLSEALLGRLGDGTTLGVRMQLLCRSEILQERLSSVIPGEKEYHFRHALMRDAAYGLLTDDDRRLGHRLAAAWLAAREAVLRLPLARPVVVVVRGLARRAAGVLRHRRGQLQCRCR